jgi:hypothetical protein
LPPLPASGPDVPKQAFPQATKSKHTEETPLAASANHSTVYVARGQASFGALPKIGAAVATATAAVTKDTDAVDLLGGHEPHARRSGQPPRSHGRRVPRCTRWPNEQPHRLCTTREPPHRGVGHAKVVQLVTTPSESLEPSSNRDNRRFRHSQPRPRGRIGRAVHLHENTAQRMALGVPVGRRGGPTGTAPSDTGRVGTEQPRPRGRIARAVQLHLSSGGPSEVTVSTTIPPPALHKATHRAVGARSIVTAEREPRSRGSAHDPGAPRRACGPRHSAVQVDKTRVERREHLILEA